MAAIGSIGDFLEIDSSHYAPGSVTALATNGVYLTETAGSLYIDEVLVPPLGRGT